MNDWLKEDDNVGIEKLLHVVIANQLKYEIIPFLTISNLSLNEHGFMPQLILAKKDTVRMTSIVQSSKA